MFELRMNRMPSVLSEQEYNQVYRILSEHRENNQQIIDSIQRNVLPKLISKKSFLDIGPGTGFITQAIQEAFQHKAVVEPSAEFNQHFAGHGYETYPTTFQQAEIVDKFDYVLCSHVLYNVHLEDWPHFFSKILNTMAGDGCASIVMSAGNGKHHEMCKLVNENHKSSAQVLDYLRKHHIKHSIDTITHCYRTTNFADMYALCRFSLLEDCFTPESYAALNEHKRRALQFKIHNYTESHKQIDDTYCLKAEVDVIHIHA
jgi:SAM-dependent methyltransferase